VCCPERLTPCSFLFWGSSRDEADHITLSLPPHTLLPYSSSRLALCISNHAHSPRTNPDLPSRTLAHTRLDHIPHVDLLDALRLDARALHRVLDGDDA
jgi:hypothetical protein